MSVTPRWRGYRIALTHWSIVINRTRCSFAIGRDAMLAVGVERICSAIDPWPWPDCERRIARPTNVNRRLTEPWPRSSRSRLVFHALLRFIIHASAPDLDFVARIARGCERTDRSTQHSVFRGFRRESNVARPSLPQTISFWDRRC